MYSPADATVQFNAYPDIKRLSLADLPWAFNTLMALIG